MRAVRRRGVRGTTCYLDHAVGGRGVGRLRTWCGGGALDGAEEQDD